MSDTPRINPHRPSVIDLLQAQANYDDVFGKGAAKANQDAFSRYFAAYSSRDHLEGDLANLAECVHAVGKAIHDGFSLDISCHGVEDISAAIHDLSCELSRLEIPSPTEGLQTLANAVTWAGGAVASAQEEAT